MEIKKEKDSPCNTCIVEQLYKGRDNEHCPDCKEREEYIKAKINPTYVKPKANPDHITGTGKSAPTGILDKSQIPKTTDHPLKTCNSKNCKHKGKPQDISNFYNNRCKPDEKQEICKDCQKEYQKNYWKKRSKKEKSQVQTKSSSSDINKTSVKTYKTTDILRIYKDELQNKEKELQFIIQQIDFLKQKQGLINRWIDALNILIKSEENQK